MMGFTGTREGMTPEQKLSVRALVLTYSLPSRYEGDSPEFGHGDCIGADADFHDIIMEVTANKWGHDRINIYPPDIAKHRAFKLVGGDSQMRQRAEKPYLDRNRDIVGDCEILVACPLRRPEPGELLTGGTWYTVRNALQRKRGVVIVWPDGQVEVATNVAGGNK